MHHGARRALFAWPMIGLAAALAAASCGTDPGVESEQSRAIESVPTTAVAGGVGDAAEPGTPLPTATTVANDPAAPVEQADDDSLLFDLERFDVIVSRRSTTLATPDAASSRSFDTAAVLPDGTVVAAGTQSSGPAATSPVLWSSVDASVWTRVDTGPGQRIQTMVNDADGRVVIATADSDRLVTAWSSDDGIDWSVRAPLGTASIRAATVIDERVVFGGSSDQGGQAATAAIYVEPAGTDVWGGRFFVGNDRPSIVNELLVIGDTLVAVGAEAVDPTLPGDVAIWRTTDAEGVWTPVRPEARAGRPAAGEAAAQIDGELFVLMSSTVGTSTVTSILRTDDLGDTWSDLALPGPADGADGDLGELAAAGMWSVNGALVVVELRLVDVDVNQVLMTVLDPQVGDAVVHDVSAELGILELNHVVDLGQVALGFGRSDTSDDPAGLQTIEIRRLDAAQSGGTSASDA